MSQKPRKDAMAFFRIWLATTVLQNIFIVWDSGTQKCQFCGEGTLNAEHLTSCYGSSGNNWITIDAGLQTTEENTDDEIIEGIKNVIKENVDDLDDVILDLV